MIVVGDIDNAIFGKFPLEIKEKYVGYANEEVRDLAIRFDVDPDAINEPLHYKIQRHAINVALNLFAQDYVDVNSRNGTSNEDDVYSELFKRTNYILQKTKNSLSAIMFTGGTETSANRAVRNVRLYRG